MDFDGTLLNDSKEVTKKTKDTLRAAREKNIKIVGVTARTLERAKNVVDKRLFDYLILNNGAFVVDENNKVIEKKVIEENEIFKEENEKYLNALNEMTNNDIKAFLKICSKKWFCKKHYANKRLHLLVQPLRLAWIYGRNVNPNTR